MSDASNSSHSDFSVSSDSLDSSVTGGVGYRKKNPIKLKNNAEIKVGGTFASGQDSSADKDDLTIATADSSIADDSPLLDSSWQEGETLDEESPSDRYSFFKFSGQNPLATMSAMPIIVDLFAFLEKLLTGIADTYVNIKKALKVGMDELPNNPYDDLTVKTSDSSLNDLSAANKDQEINQGERKKGVRFGQSHTVTFDKENPPNEISKTLEREAGELGGVISGKSGSITGSGQDSKPTRYKRYSTLLR